MKQNIILFGGGFDPVHNGHLNMAYFAAKKYDATVIFIPAKVSIWKEKGRATSEEKYGLLLESIKDYKDFMASDYEINSKNDHNYTIDTVKYFKEVYPNNDLFLLIGADQVNSFHKWKDAEEISNLAKIIFFSRPGYELSDENIKFYKMDAINGDLINESSTAVYELKSLNLNLNAINYIIDNDLYFTKKLKSFMSEHRFKHSRSVAELAYKIAEANKIDNPGRFYMTGLLHDIAKDMKMDEQKRIMKEHYSEFLDIHPVIYHQFVGEYVTREVYGVLDQEILEAIKYHTTGNKNMSTLAKVIYAADKIEPTRGYDSRDMIKAMYDNIDDGFKYVLSENRKFFIEKNIDYGNSLTKECFEFYLD